MKTAIACCLFLMFNLSLCPAQDASLSDSLAPGESLHFMIGTWKGEGWIMRNRERKEFTQSEIIRPRLDGQILVIDGLGLAKDTTSEQPTIIHDAFGVISYNQELGPFTMMSFSSTGGKMENPIRMTGEKQLEWSFQEQRGGTIRFREDFSTKDRWVEVGEYSPHGEEWFPFFQMTLEKQQE